MRNGKELWGMRWINKTERQNKTYIYLMPMLFHNVWDICKDLMINAYIGDIKVPDLNKHILMAYEKDESIRFSNLIAYFKKHENYAMQYEYEDENVIIFAFNIPDRHLLNYNAFLKGKYSAFDDNYKKHIINFFSLNASNTICDILYKRESRYKELEEYLGTTIPRNLDCSSIYDEKYELIGNLEEEASASSF
jgi:hypothetical protein